MLDNLYVEFDSNNSMIVKRGHVLDFVVKGANTYAIVIVGFNLYEIELDKLRVIKEEE